MKIKNSTSNEKNVRFSVVISESQHKNLEDYVREYSFKTSRDYAKSDFVRDAIFEALYLVEHNDGITPLGVPFNPAKPVKAEPNMRFSVVIGESYHTRLESFIREYSYKTRVDYKKSDFVRDAVYKHIEIRKCQP